MNDSWFWRVVAVMALLVALGYVVSRFTGAPPVRAGGEGGFILQTEADQNVIKVYLLDTSRKVLIMYGSPQRYDLTMHASRFIDIDCEATVGKEFPGKARGWSLREVQRSMGDSPRRR